MLLVCVQPDQTCFSRDPRIIVCWINAWVALRMFQPSSAVQEPQTVVVSDMDAFTQRLNAIVQVLHSSGPASDVQHKQAAHLLQIVPRKSNI